VSLKIFHIFFITLSTLLCAGVAWWCFEHSGNEAFGWIFVAVGALLPVYGVWFLKKTKKLIL